jgi:4-amino-4-deoxy-L-arabinose transferase-like glycosyltransferase
MLAAWIVLPGLALAYFIAAPGSRGRRLAWIGGGYGATVGTALGGGAGPLRLFDAEVGGQIAWLLPLALVSLVVAACRARGAEPRTKAGWALWGGWLVAGAAVFSFTGGIFHAYYTAELAPAIAALSAAGLATAWRWQRSPGPARFVLPGAVTGTALLAYVLLDRTPEWQPWLRYTVLALAVLAVVAALLRAPRAVVVTGLAAVVAGPAAFVVDTAVRPVSVLETADPGAGPPSTDAVRTVVGINTGQGAEAGYVRFIDDAYRLSAGQREVLAYAQTQAAGTVLAVEGGTYGADPFLLNTDARVAPLGGYIGFDPAPSAADLPQWVSTGKLRFVLLPQVFLEIGRGASKSAVGDAGELTRRIGWEAKHCRPVPPARIGPDAAGAGVLFDCGVRR